MFKNILLILTAMLTGCASVQHIPLSQENSQHIKAVFVNPDIAKPASIYVFASGEEFGMPFGALGGAIASVRGQSVANDMKKFSEGNHVDISKIVYHQWINQIKQGSTFKTSAKPTDTVLNSTIVLYGISIPHGFSTDYVPVLLFNSNIKQKDKIIWQDSGKVMPFTGGMPRYKMDEISKDPHKLYLMWDKAAEKIVADMISNLRQ